MPQYTHQKIIKSDTTASRFIPSITSQKPRPSKLPLLQPTPKRHFLPSRIPTPIVQLLRPPPPIRRRTGPTFPFPIPRFDPRSPVSCPCSSVKNHVSLYISLPPISQFLFLFVCLFLLPAYGWFGATVYIDSNTWGSYRYFVHKKKKFFNFLLVRGGRGGPPGRSGHGGFFVYMYTKTMFIFFEFL